MMTAAHQRIIMTAVARGASRGKPRAGPSCWCRSVHLVMTAEVRSTTVTRSLLVAVARKILVTLNAMLKTNTAFRPC
jgi:hypothetical protein